MNGSDPRESQSSGKKVENLRVKLAQKAHMCVSTNQRVWYSRIGTLGSFLMGPSPGPVGHHVVSKRHKHL